MEQFLFFGKMGTDGFPDLDSAQEFFLLSVATDHSLFNLNSIGKSKGIRNRIDFADMISLILFQFIGKAVQIIIHCNYSCFSTDFLLLADFEFQFGFRRMMPVCFDFFQEQIPIVSLEVLDFKTRNFDFFHQLQPISIHCIQNIHHIMVFFMGSRII